MRKVTFKFKSTEGKAFSFSIGNYAGDMTPDLAKEVLEGVCKLNLFQDDEGHKLTATPVGVSTIDTEEEDVYTQSN
jgi:hypothetical protein